MAIETACELSSAQVHPSLGLADGQVCTAKMRTAIRHVAAALEHQALGFIDVADACLDPSGEVALRCDRIETWEP